MRREGPRDFEFYSLCAVYGLLAFRLLFPFIQKGPVTENHELPLYVTGWVTAVAWGFLLGWVTTRLTRGRHGDAELTPHLLLNFLYLLFLLSPISWAPNWKWAHAAGFLAVQWAASRIARSGLVREKGGLFPAGRLYGVGVACFAVWVLALSYKNLSATIREWSLIQYLAAMLVAWLLVISLPVSKGAKKAPSTGNWIGYGAVLLAIAYLVYDPSFTHDEIHANAYVAQLADLAAGKTMLVDVYGLYGVLSYITLGHVFQVLPLNYKTFVLLDMALRILQYFLFYIVAVRLFGRGLFSLLALAILLLANHLGYWTAATITPNMGPLRFGFIYVLLALVVLRDSHPRLKGWFWLLEAVVAGIAAFWGLETCLYTLPAYLGLVLYESVETKGGFRVDGGSLFRRLGMLFGALLAVGGWIFLECLVRAGSPPDVSHYLELVRAFRTGWMLLPMPAMGFWWAVVGVLYISLFAVLALTGGNGAPSPRFPLNAVFLANVYGIFQFIYYLGRSNWPVLFSISMPAILLAAFWLHTLRHHDPPSVPGAVKTGAFRLAVLFTALYLPATLPWAWGKIRNQTRPPRQAAQSLLEVLRSGQPGPDSWGAAVGRLMDKYSDGRVRVPYFLGMAGVHVCLDSGKTRVHPYCSETNQFNSSSFLQWVWRYPADLEPGDAVYFLPEYLARKGYRTGERIVFKDAPGSPSACIPGDRQPQENFEIGLLREIDRQYPILWVESSGTGVVVGRLGPGPKKAGNGS